MKWNTILLLASILIVFMTSLNRVAAEDWSKYKNCNNYDIVYTAAFSTENEIRQFKIIKVYKGVAGDDVKSYLKKEAEYEMYKDGTYLFAMNYGFPKLPLHIERLDSDEEVKVIEEGGIKKIIVVRRDKPEKVNP